MIDLYKKIKNRAFLAGNSLKTPQNLIKSVRYKIPKISLKHQFLNSPQKLSNNYP